MQITATNLASWLAYLILLPSVLELTCFAFLWSLSWHNEVIFYSFLGSHLSCHHFSKAVVWVIYILNKIWWRPVEGLKWTSTITDLFVNILTHLLVLCYSLLCLFSPCKWEYDFYWHVNLGFSLELGTTRLLATFWFLASFISQSRSIPLYRHIGYMCYSLSSTLLIWGV